MSHLPLNSSPLPAETGPESFLPRAVTFGTYCTVIRRLRPDDAERLVEFFQSHQEDTVRARYGYLIAETSPSRAAATRPPGCSPSSRGTTT